MIIRTVKTAKAKLLNPTPQIMLSAPRTIATAAPSDAPELTPKTYGSDKGLRKRAWNAIPHTANPAPATAEKRTRGSRKKSTIYTSFSLTFGAKGRLIPKGEIRACKAFAALRVEAPTMQSTKQSPVATKQSKAKTMRFLVRFTSTIRLFICRQLVCLVKSL